MWTDGYLESKKAFYANLERDIGIDRFEVTTWDLRVHLGPMY